MTPHPAEQAPHHFTQPDPADLVEREVGRADVGVQGPQPPRPWWFLVARQWPTFAVLLVVTAGVALAGASSWRLGTSVVGGGVLLAAVLRAVLPETLAGLLCCRSRAIDVTFTAALGAAIVGVTWVIDPTRG